MLFLGFSAGLPLLLVFGTLSFWLREAGSTARRSASSAGWRWLTPSSGPGRRWSTGCRCRG